MRTTGERGRAGNWIASPRLRNLAWCVFFVLLMLAMQYRSGAYTADLAFDHDEPSHAVSALMVHDYLAQDLPHNPLAFARAFYAHYPKVAVGHWPPLFYCGEAVWMLVAGRTRVAMLLFVALCGAGLVCSLFFLVRNRCSTPAALLTVAIAVHASVFQEMLFCVRPDLLESLLILWAAICCGEFLIAYSRRARVWFIMLSVLALGVHWRAAVLLIVPLALLPLRKPRHRWKWSAVAVCVGALMVLPGLTGAANPYHWSMLARHVGEYLFGAAFLTAWVGAALALIGMVLVFRRTPQQAFWASIAALAVSGLLFYLFVPIQWDYRLILPTLQAVAVLAGGGTHVLLERFKERTGAARRWLPRAIAACAIVWLGTSLLRMERKPTFGYRLAVSQCLLCGHEVTLVSGDPLYEGGLIVEASLADPARTRTILRGSKELASSTWAGNHYRALFASSQQILDDLAQKQVTLIVVQNAPIRPEAVQLHAAVTGNQRDWTLVQDGPQIPGASIYRRVPPPS